MMGLLLAMATDVSSMYPARICSVGDTMQAERALDHLTNWPKSTEPSSAVVTVTMGPLRKDGAVPS
jgi:hypothetical protein